LDLDQDQHNEQTPCPCDSGLAYDACCGRQDHSQVNIVASISSQCIHSEEPLSPQLQTALDHLDTSPDLFPARINFAEGQAWFVKMSPRWYRESVFLDPARIKGSCIIQTELAWLQEITDRIVDQPNAYIFHTAFCGSTLMSQALDAAFQTLPVREPEVLGNLMMYLRNPDKLSEDKDAWYRRIMALLSRRYEEHEVPVIKANDYANPMMLAMIERQTQAPQLFMYTPLREFLAGCLKADNRKQWIAQRYKNLLPAIHYRLGLGADFHIDENSYGELAALYWSFNIVLFNQAYRHAPESIRSLEFSAMLKNTPDAIKRCGKWFELEPRENVDIEQAIAPLFGVYSKNSKFTYSPAQREKDITDLVDANKEELMKAEKLAYQLLGKDYPHAGLHGSLLA